MVRGRKIEGRKIILEMTSNSPDIPDMTSNGPETPEMTSNGPDALIIPAVGRSPIGHGPGNDHVSCKEEA